MINFVTDSIIESNNNGFKYLLYKPNKYAFRMAFNPGVIPTGLVTTIAGSRWDYLTEADEIAGVETKFLANTPCPWP